MAIYGEMTWKNEDGKYMVARSTKIKATDCGHLYDLVDAAADVEQGCNIKVGDYTGNGLQERKAETPAEGDAIAFVCSVPLIYESYRTSDQFEWKFVNVKGKDFRAYEIVKDDIFGVSDYGFTTILDAQKGVEVGNYVVVDGNRKWKEVKTAPDTKQYGFIGKVIGYEKYQYDTIVLIHVIKNETVVAGE